MNRRCESAGGDVTYIGWLTEPVKAGVRLKLACAGAPASENDATKRATLAAVASGESSDTVAPVDASVPMYDMRTVHEQVEVSLVTERLMATLSTVFGSLATLLAAMGCMA